MPICAQATISDEKRMMTPFNGDGGAFFSVYLLLGLFIHMCSGEQLSCSMTRDDNNGWIYKVSPPIENMTPDGFSWSNSNTPVATNLSPNNAELGIIGTYDSLSSPECYENMMLTKHYTNKDGTLKDFPVNCSFSCTIPSNQVQDGPSKTWIAVVVVVVVVVVLFFVLIGLLVKFRDKVFRKCCCSQTGGFFTPVKVIQDVPLNEVKVTVSGKS